MTQAFLTPDTMNADRIIVDGLQELPGEHIRLLVAEESRLGQLSQLLDAAIVGMELLLQGLDPMLDVRMWALACAALPRSRRSRRRDCDRRSR